MKLADRCEELLHFPLTEAEREYVVDLLRRISSGKVPILFDWFRSRELVGKHTGKPMPPSLNGPRRRRR